MKIEVGKDFSITPGGRLIKDGPDSGQLFRERFLLRSLRQAVAEGSKLEVILDGPEGYLSSFLEEAFGGLVRHGHFTKDQLNKSLSIVSINPFYETYKRIAERAIATAELSEKIAS